MDNETTRLSRSSARTSSSSEISSPSSSPASSSSLRRRRFRSQHLNPLGTLGRRSRISEELVFERGGFVVGIGDSGPDGYPTGSDRRVPSEDVEAPAPETKMFDEMKDFGGLLGTSVFGLLTDDQIDVHVRVDEIAVCRTTNGALKMKR